jgi:RNA polymerase sigma-70 factor (ECF subfamily)
MPAALSFAMNDELDRRFELWIERNRAMIERFFKRRGCSADLTADLVQDTMEVIWRKRANFRGELERSFRAWAIMIAKTIWLKHWRPYRPPLEALPEEIEAASADPETLAEKQELRDALRAQLDQLPPQERTCAMFHLLGCSEKEIAVLLGRAPGTVKAHSSHVRAKLKPVVERFRAYLDT